MTEEIQGTSFADNEAEGEWFTFFESRINEKNEAVYDDPKPGAARMQLRSIAPFFEKRPEPKKVFEWVPNTITGKMERAGYYPEKTRGEVKAEMDEAWDYAITGLEKFYIGKELIPCTKEGKAKLRKVPAFDRFLARCTQLLASSGVKAKEDAEKN
ncbi:MAG: hypothetical protein WC750_06340 [Patescibacteria group bacterium]|jgi:hypothetical protein